MEKRNKCIDCMKAIACALIVFIHYPFPSLYGQIVKAIARSAVPFFLIVSGYFYGNNYKKGDFHAKKYVIASFKLLVMGMTFSLAIIFLREKSAGYILQMLEPFNIYKFVLFNDTGEIYHLWYICALLYCYVGTIALNIKTTPNIKWLGGGCILLVILRFVIETYLRAIGGEEIYYFRNWLFTGVPLFGLGFILSNVEANKLFLRIHYVSLTAVGIILSIIEYTYVGNREMYIGSIAIAIGIFVFALNNPDFQLSNNISKFGKSYSAYVFVLHWGIMHVEYKVIDIFNLQNLRGGIYLWVSPIMLFIYTAVSAVVCGKVICFLTRNIKRIKYER